MKYLLAAGVAVLAVAANATAARAAEDARPLLEFNERVLAIAESEDGFLTLKGLRTAAMMHLAAHDTLVSTLGRHELYAYGENARDMDPVGSAAQALYAVAASQYPGSQKDLEAIRDRYLPADAGARRRALELGRAAAEAVMALRADDGWNAEAEYAWHPMAPGVYAEFNQHSGTPEGFVFGAGWARAKPFALAAPDQFRAPPPPAIDTDEYTRAFGEVKAVGRYQSMTRTPEQTHVALWWKDFAENSHNRLARDLVRRERLGLAEAARLFALLNVAIYDAYVNVFDNKFHYNHWRPYTAIRWAANDGNPATEPEGTWTNTHRHTYAFPSYPSAHGSACAAAQSVIADVFGDDYAFTMRTPTVDIAGPFSGKFETRPPVRRFDSPWQAADECGASRVYLGIHFRYDSVEGVKLGRRIGEFVVDHYLRPKTGR